VDPASVIALDEDLDLMRTLFVVSSKSGTTIETASLYRYFLERVRQEGVSLPGRHFVAVTDAGSPLAQEATREGFRAVFEAPADVGGRYSALTPFGLLPMALMGADVDRVIEWARQLEHEISPSLPEKVNPAVRLGTELALYADGGRSRLTLSADEQLAAFLLWVEQLVAESTGKSGLGILPIVVRDLPSPAQCRPDRVFVHYGLAGNDDNVVGAGLEALEAAGHPVYRIVIPEPEALGGEFVRWEVATATASSLLGVNPFDEPDVAAAKQATRQCLDQLSGGAGPETEEGIDVWADAASGAPGPELRQAISEWIGDAGDGSYVAALGYFRESPARNSGVAHLRQALAARTGLPTTFGYGPRYLHSTGQLHKGGPSGGLFVVLTADPSEDLALPGADFTFGKLQRAQAMGDMVALRERGRRVLHVNLGWHIEDGLNALADAVRP